MLLIVSVTTATAELGWTTLSGLFAPLATDWGGGAGTTSVLVLGSWTVGF